MENTITNKEVMEIEVGEKTLKLCFPTRTSAQYAEDMGLEIMKIAEKPLTTTSMLFYTGLLAKQPDITKDEAEKLLEQYVSEGGETGEINDFLLTQLTNFSKSPNGKKKKKAKIVKI